MLDLDERAGDIWKYHKEGWYIIITTNGVVRADGECVMGAGIAKQAKVKVPAFARVLGKHVARYGNVVGVFPGYRFISFPVKHHWYEEADLDLIEQSARDLDRIVTILNEAMGGDHRIASVRPGCGNGKLDWEDVKPVIEPWFVSSGITVVNL